MRERLFDAVMSVCAQKGPDSVLIEDVLREAGVSKATFYAHFDTLQQAISTLGHRLADEIVVAFNASYADIEDPVLRNALGPNLALSRAVLEPGWGRIFSHSESFASHSIFVKTIRKTLTEGCQSGAFKIEDIDAGVDMHVGTLVRAAGELQKKKVGRADYIHNVTAMLLIACCVPADHAHTIARQASEGIRVRAPNVFVWWRPFT